MTDTDLRTPRWTFGRLTGCALPALSACRVLRALVRRDFRLAQSWSCEPQRALESGG